GAKYAIANSDDRYTGDDPGNGDHDRDVIGIGTESDGSNTQARAAGLQLGQNSNFGNGDYLLAGHAAAENTINTTDVGGGFAARWDRTWWLDVTDAGSAMTVDFTFDLSEGGLGGSADGTTADYQLVFRSGTSGSWTAQATATSVSGDQVRFTNVAVTTDGQYTLATLDNSGDPLGENPGTLGCDGPGGIGSTDGSSDLELWLDAESLLGADDDPLVSFYDQSGNGHHADELDPVNIPVIKTAVRNGMDAIRFDGNDYIQGDLGTALSAQATILAVATFHNDQGAGENDYVLSLGNPTTTNRHVSISRRRSDVAADHNKYYSWDGNSTRFGPVISTNAWNIFHQEHNTSAPFHSLYLDGAAQSVADYSSGFSATATDYRLGHWLNGFTNGIDGDIAEVIIFDRLLNSAERNILTAYLGAKFNISVTDDVYAGDDAGNSDHDREVAGIGTESDGSNTCAASGGLRMAQNSNFGNGDYVVFGHNVVTNRSQDTDIAHGSATLEERWERVWWVDVTDAGAALTVDITFDFSEADIPGIYPNGSATNYQLLFRSGTTGSWSTLATATSLSGDQIAFNNVAITADGQYTLATLAAIASPLPIELLHFGAALHEPHSVLLTWETATETNNDHFTVEKSRNGSVFATVGHQPGAGESRERKQYRMVDPAPYAGTSYYRLKQTDRNGTVSYSHLAPVHVEQQANIRVFPNPATDHLTIACNLAAAAQAQLEVWTPDGRLQAVVPLPLTSGSNQVKLPVNAWSHGWHILRISGLDRPYYFRVFRE
ncbi:MAG: hypothetical protein AAGB22_04545, partial [Bacteroidota bacterium]